MKYMLVNTSTGAMQIDLHHPTPTYNRKNLHRPGPVIAINIPRGEAKDILPFFEGSLEEADKCVKFSKDVMRGMKSKILHIYVCDDNMKPLNLDALLGKGMVDEEAPEDESEDENPNDESPENEGSESESSEDEDPEGSEDEEPEPEDDEDSEGEDDEDEEPDDLTVIKGVGGASEEKLNSAGYYTIKSVADADSAKLKELLGNNANKAQASAVELLLENA